MRKKKTAQKKRRIGGRKGARKKRAVRRKPPLPGVGPALDIVTIEPEGLGSNVAGQSGDIEQLSNVPVGNSQSVTELVEAGQDLEAEVVSGVESAPEPDQAEVTTHERHEQYAPREYEEEV
jgi:hypothetical protein